MSSNNLKHYVGSCSVCGKPMPVFRETKPSDDEIVTHDKCKTMTTEYKARELLYGYLDDPYNVYLDNSREERVGNPTSNVIEEIDAIKILSPLINEVAELKAEIREFKDWISVAEKLPPHNQEVLMCRFDVK